MMNDKIMQNFIRRTDGEVYIGVVGSVRSGKSSFINKFFKEKILPFIKDEYTKNKILDDLPQSAQGKQIMTVEPKFIPSQAVSVNVFDDLLMNVRLVDCVGFLIPNATGHFTEDGPRMVKTPWFEEEIPFKEAAEIGTRKVILNHSTVGIMITSDGSFGEFSRSDYALVEDEIINELKSLDKPFVVVLNTSKPYDEETIRLVNDLETQYEVKVMALDVLNIKEKDIDAVLNNALQEFPIAKLTMTLPDYINSLKPDYPVKKNLDDAILNISKEFTKYKDIQKIKESLEEIPYVDGVEISDLDDLYSSCILNIYINDDVYEQIINDLLGSNIDTKAGFLALLQEFIDAKEVYDKYKQALISVDKTGYGIAYPIIKDLELETPEVIKQSGRYGVKLTAKGKMIHMISVDVTSNFEPIIGSLEQSKILIDSLVSNKQDLKNVWNEEIFGRKLSEVINDGMIAKISKFPDKAKLKLKDTLEKVINEGNGGLIAIIL